MPRPDDPTPGSSPQGSAGSAPAGSGGSGPPNEPDDPFASIDEVMAESAEAARPADDQADEIDAELGQMLAGASADPAAAAERDEYREALQRLKAEFDNFRKRTAKETVETRQRASEALVIELLPVLDACDAAVVHDATDVGPISKMLLETLEKQGLEPMVVEGQTFDPLLHEAVLHEPGDGGEAVVIESLRTGYLWKGRVLRPAMVKVKG